jgi:DNA primase
MSSSVEKIKERLSVVDVISSYITVEQSGKNYKARCPFHNEKTPSFFISPERGSYYCFGCGAKGDIFSFVENFEGLDFLGSLKLLADRAGVVLDNTRQEEKDSKEEYFKIMEEATRFFEYNYENNAEVRAYLVSRGLRDETIKNFRIGYSLDGWSSLYNHLIKKGYKEKDIEIVGLIKKGKTDKFYDRFRSRIMFPISDSSGRVIAFSGRIFYLSNSQKREDIEEAKYINSPDTPLFNKSNVLFGVDKAKTEIKKRGYSILVEGQMDLIMSHQFGFTNTIAVSGTALTDSLIGDENKINNLGLIKRLSSNIILAFDGDNAGQRAVGRSSLIALSLDMQVKVAELSGDEDPADIILREPEAWANIIKNSLNVIEFYLKKICEINLDTRIRGKKIREIIFPLLQSVKSSIERDSYIDMISKKIGISRDSILEDFNNFIKGFKIKEENKILVNDDKKLKRKDLLERNVMGIFFWRESQHHDILDIENHLRGIGIDYLNKIKENYTPYKEELIFEIERDYGGGKDEMIGRSIKEMILDLEEEYLKEKIKLLGEIGEEKLFEFNEIRKRIEEIKNNRLL